MRVKFTLLAALVVAFFSANAQQLPNASFDSWTTDTLAPDGWSTYESYFGTPLGHAEKDATDKVFGAYSLKLTSDSVPNFASYGVLAGVAAVGKGIGGGQPQFSGIPFAFRPDTMFVVYKYTSVSPDTPLIYLRINKAGVGVLGHPVYGLPLLLPPTASWATGGAVLTDYYANANVPDTLKLELYSSQNPGPNGGVKGSVLRVDGILFAYKQLPSALQEVADELSIRLYPNPTTDVINIATAKNAEGFRALVFDMNGRAVTGVELSGVSNSINVSALAAGTYVCRIADANGNIIKQERFSVAK